MKAGKANVYQARSGKTTMNGLLASMQVAGVGYFATRAAIALTFAVLLSGAHGTDPTTRRAVHRVD
jgi:hypothetical protein